MTHDSDAKPPSRRWFVVTTLLGLMASLPFLAPFKAPPIPSFHAEMLAIILGLAAVSATLVILRGRAIPLPRIAWIPGLFCLVIVGQLLANRVPSVQPSLLGALYLLWAAALIVVGAALRSALGLTRSATLIAWFVLTGGMLSAFAGLGQILHSDTLSFWVAPSAGDIWGNLGQRNHFANYIALALCSALFLWVHGKLGHTAFAFCAGLLAAILPMSGSRSVWLYVFAFLILALVWFLRDRSLVNRRVLWATAILPLLMFGSSMVWTALGIDDLSAPTSLERLQGASAEERPGIWHGAWLMLLGSPVAGVGFGQFAWNFFGLNPRLSLPIEGYTHNAHNLLLHVGAEMGIAGLLVLGLAVVFWLRAVRRLAVTPAAWWALSVTAVLGVHAMLEYPLWYGYFLGLAALVFGLTEGGKIEFAPSRFLRGMLVVALMLGWFVSWQLFRDYRFLEDYLSARGKVINATEKVGDEALQRLLAIRRQSLLAPLVELGLARSIQISPDQLKAKLDVNSRAMRNYPVDDVVYRQAFLLAMSGQSGEASRQWDLALVSYPDLAPVARVVLREQAQRVDGGMSALLEHVEALPGR